MLLVLGKNPYILAAKLRKIAKNWEIQVCTKLSKMTHLGKYASKDLFLNLNGKLELTVQNIYKILRWVILNRVLVIGSSYVVLYKQISRSIVESINLL